MNGESTCEDREWKAGDRCRIARSDDAPTGTVVSTAYMGAVVVVRIDGDAVARTYLARRLHPAVLA